MNILFIQNSYTVVLCIVFHLKGLAVTKYIFQKIVIYNDKRQIKTMTSAKIKE